MPEIDKPNSHLTTVKWRFPSVHPEGRNAEVPVNRTDAIGFMGGAQNTNEECYLFQKAARLLGLAYVEHQARL